MNQNWRNVMCFVLISAALCAAIASPMQRVRQEFRPDSASERVKPVLPALLQLTPKNPVHPAATLAGVDISVFDPISNTMHFYGEFSAAAVRIRDQQEPTSYTVEFVLRIRNAPMAFLTKANSADPRGQVSKLTLASGLQRVLLRGRTVPGKGAVVVLNCEKKEAAWEVIAVKITKP